VSVDDSDPTGVPSSSKWRPHAIAPDASSVLPKDRGGVENAARDDAWLIGIIGKLYSLPETAIDTDAWVYNIRTYSHALLYDDVPTNSDRNLVRVAIIDSGLATANDNTDLVVPEQIFRWIRGAHVAYKDFTNVESTHNDSTTNLHGTWCASLFMQTATVADLYIANVAGRGKWGYKGDYVAAAIAWAVENEVDIISMSFGWTVPFAKVDEQIDVARSKGIL
jgi:hypothetical protein